MKAKAIRNKIVLQKKFLDDLGAIVESHSNIKEWPLIVSISDPIPLTFALYIYENKNPAGGRPNKEYKFNLYVPFQKRGEDSSFDYSEGLPLVVSYTEEYDVYILYDPEKHPKFRWCANVQSRIDTILDACCDGLATTTKKNGEIQIAVTSKRLIDGIMKRMAL